MEFKVGSLRTRMFVTILFVVTGLAVLLISMAGLAMRSGFSSYLHTLELQRLEPIVALLEARHAKERNWSALKLQETPWPLWLSQNLPPSEFAKLSPPRRPPHPRHHAELPEVPNGPPQGVHQRPRFPKGDKLGLLPRSALLDSEGQLLAGNPRAVDSEFRTAIRVEREVVGYLALVSGDGDAALEKEFASRQWPNVLLLMIAAVAGSFAASWFLAKNLTQPLILLSDGARQMADGELSVRVELERSDELGRLADNFNSMAETLESAEKARKKWLADTSHELRTPVAIIQAEIEAIQDGIHQADEKTLALLHAEAKGLGKLIRGLGKLGMSPTDDAPVYREMDLGSFLDKAVERFATRFSQHGVELECLVRQKVTIQGDHIGLETLVSNLLENSVRFTNRGGRVEWSLIKEDQQAVLIFDDTEPAPKPENLDKLFDRFFREESSRSRKLGGSGIGLSLCKQIVTEHGGAIQALISPLGGLRTRITLPLAQSPERAPTEEL